MCNGGTVLWVELTVHQPASAGQPPLNATVDEHYGLCSPPAFDASEVAWDVCDTPERLPPRPPRWQEMLALARRLGSELAVFARLDVCVIPPSRLRPAAACHRRPHSLTP